MENDDLGTVISGTELFNKCVQRLENPNINRLELNTVFNDLNVMLMNSFMEEDEYIGVLWFELGVCLNKMGHMVMAMVCFKESIKLKPKFIEAINNLGYVCKKLNLSQEAEEAFAKAVELIEDKELNYPATKEARADYYVNYGSMFVCAGTPEKALEYFKKGEEIAPNYRQVIYNKSLALLELGDYENGFVGYDAGDRYDRVIDRNYGHEKLPVWDGTKGKNVVVIGEQGIGDELMFGTVLPDLIKDCNIILDAHPRLADMFRRSFPNLDVYGTRKHNTFQWGARYPLDAKVLIGSLPRYYRKKESDFPRIPYLIVHPVYNERYGNKLQNMGDRPKIGISWRGGIKQTGRNNRYIPLEKLLPLLKLPVDFISLQYDPGILGDIEKFNKQHGVNIHHWPEMLEDYEQTAACVNNLDLIISVPQSVIHLSGVIGSTLTWQLNPFKSLWQSGPHGKEMPWYPNVVNYWQDSSCKWDLLLEKVQGDLCKLLQTNTEN